MQYLKNKVNDEVFFFCIQINIDSMGMVKNFQSSKNSKFALLQYLKKKVKTEVDFLHAEFPKSLFQHLEHQSFLQGWYYHY